MPEIPQGNRMRLALMQHICCANKHGERELTLHSPRHRNVVFNFRRFDHYILAFRHFFGLVVCNVCAKLERRVCLLFWHFSVHLLTLFWVHGSWRWVSNQNLLQDYSKGSRCPPHAVDHISLLL